MSRFHNLDPTNHVRKVYIFDEKVVDRATMISKAAASGEPYEIHYHKAGSDCNEICETHEGTLQ